MPLNIERLFKTLIKMIALSEVIRILTIPQKVPITITTMLTSDSTPINADVTIYLYEGVGDELFIDSTTTKTDEKGVAIAQFIVESGKTYTVKAKFNGLRTGYIYYVPCETNVTFDVPRTIDLATLIKVSVLLQIINSMLK